MITVWTKHLKTEDEKTGFEQQFRNSADVLERLTEILDEIDEDLERSEMSVKAYESPTWAYLQAHKNGYRQSIRDVKKLINLDQRSTNER